MTTVSTSVTDTLQHIALEARRWASRLSVHQQCTTAASTSHRHIDFYVPDPQPIIRDLLTTGLPQKFAEQISEAYLEKAFILKREFDCHIQRALSVCNDPIPDQSAKLSSLIKKTFLSRYTEVLKGWAETAMSMSRTYIAKSTTFDEHRVPETRTTFRQEALPALEEFFYQNPYPSRFEKKELANATGLQYKQIHTWFQNRRSRSKKVGNDSNRTTFSAEPSSPPPALPSPVIQHTPLQSTLVGAVNVLESSATCSSPSDHLLLDQRPAHAYPSPYPPSCTETPFPCKSGRGQFSVSWRRNTSSHSDHHHVVVDMEQLALVFAKMNLHDDNLSPIQEVSSQIKPALTFATIPLPAPIPANIRTFPPPTSILRTPSKAGSTIKTMFGEEEGSIMHSFTPSSSRMLLIRTSTRESTSSSTIPPSSSIYATSLRSVLNSLPSSNSLFSSPSLPPIELPSDPAKLPFPGYVTPLSRSCGSTRLDSLFTSNSIPIGALRTAFV